MSAVAFDISALDPQFKSHAQRGIGRYVHHVADYLKTHERPGLDIRWFDHESLIRTGAATRLIDLLPFARTTLRQQLLYPLKLRSGTLKGATCIHFPAHMDGPAWCPTPYILTVHDLIPLILEPLYRANRPNWRFEFARWLENTSIRNASLLLAVSDTTARDVHRLLGVPKERIVVTPNGVENSFFDLFELRRTLSVESRVDLRRRLRIPEGRPILFYVGGHDERKNIRMVVEIAREVISDCAERGRALPILVMAGRVNSEREREVLNTALRDFAMAADTVELGFVPDDDLRALYAESAVFLFPSLYEGFGLPVLEASAAGVPVVSSNRGACPEVLGTTGILFDPTDSIAGANAVLQVLGDQSVARRLSEEGHNRARLFTWERTGRLTLDAYEYAAQIIADPRSVASGSRQPHQGGLSQAVANGD